MSLKRIFFTYTIRILHRMHIFIILNVQSSASSISLHKISLSNVMKYEK